MIRQAFDRLWKDKRGNALIIMGAALPMLVGSAGLATDTIQWMLWKRQLQRTADSASLAAAYAKLQAENVDSAVSADISKNNQTKIALIGTPIIAYPPNSTTTPKYTNAVSVTLSLTKQLVFSSMITNSAPTITATGIAASVKTGKYCVVSLDGSTSIGVNAMGNPQVNLGCGIKSNSINSTDSVNVGNNATLTADPIAAQGGLTTSDFAAGTNLLPFQPKEPDPFANLYPTAIPTSVACTNFNSHISSTTNNGLNGQNRVITNAMTPGCYSSFSLSGQDVYNLAPGVYYLDSTNFSTAGGVTVRGTGVTIILTGTTPGTFTTNGNSTIDLTAPTSGTYEKMLIIQSSAASDTGGNNSPNLINGSASSKYDGALYFPNQQVGFSGTSGLITQCAMVVGKRVDFSGNATIQNDKTSCHADKTVSTSVIRLVG